MLSIGSYLNFDSIDEEEIVNILKFPVNDCRINFFDDEDMTTELEGAYFRTLRGSFWQCFSKSKFAKILDCNCK